MLKFVQGPGGQAQTRKRKWRLVGEMSGGKAMRQALVQGPEFASQGPYKRQSNVSESGKMWPWKQGGSHAIAGREPRNADSL